MMGRGGPASKIALCGDACGCINRYLPGKCLQGIQKWEACSRKSREMPARNSKTETVQSEEQGNACKEIKNGKLTVKNQGELRSEPGKGKIDSKESRGITVRTGKREN